MKEKYHEEIDQKLFNDIATKYFQKDINDVSSVARKFQLNSLINLYFNNSRKNKLGNILELGCGVGASTRYLKDMYDNYIGIDYSEKFIQLAHEHFANQNNNFFCANIKDFQIENNDKIDFVFGVGVLHHVDNIKDVLKNIKQIGNNQTVYGFIEPQSSNPFIQFMRKIRMVVDKEYSSEQAFFKKIFIKEMFNKNGYDIIAIKYQGYFSSPFAQVILRPKFIFKPFMKILIWADRMIQDNMNNLFSWNIMWLATKK